VGRPRDGAQMPRAPRTSLSAARETSQTPVKGLVAYMAMVKTVLASEDSDFYSQPRTLRLREGVIKLASESEERLAPATGQT